MIELYTAPTPNGHKASCTLEAMALPYEVHLVNISVGDQHTSEFANWCWVRTYKWSGVSRDGLENLDRWLNAMKEIPAMQRGVQVPVSMESLLNDEKAAEEFINNARHSVQT